MKSIRATALAFLLAISSLATCGVLQGGETLYPTDIQRIKDRGELVVAQFSGFRPGFFFYDPENEFKDHTYPEPGQAVDADSRLAYNYEGNKLIGYDINLAYRIAQELKVKLRFIRTAKDFNAVCRQVANHEADVAISKLSVTYARSQYVLYTHPYCILRTGVLVNRLLEGRSGRGPDPMDLCNHSQATLGVIPGTSLKVFTENLFPNASFEEYPNLDKLFEAVLRKDVLGVYYDEFELKRKLRTIPAASVYARLGDVPGKIDMIAMAVAPDSPNLLAFLNTFLGRERIQATADEVLNVYFPLENYEDDESDMDFGEVPEKNQFPKYAATAILAALIVALMLLARWKTPAQS